MTLTNLSYVFGPILLKSPKGLEKTKHKKKVIHLLSLMISEYSYLFDAEELTSIQKTPRLLSPRRSTKNLLNNAVPSIKLPTKKTNFTIKSKSSRKEKTKEKQNDIKIISSSESDDDTDSEDDQGGNDSSDEESDKEDKSWKNLVNKWKKKYRDEAKKAKSIKKETQIKNEEYELKIEELNSKIRSLSDDHTFELKKKDREIENLKRELDYKSQNYSKELDFVKKNHLLEIKELQAKIKELNENNKELRKLRTNQRLNERINNKYEDNIDDNSNIKNDILSKGPSDDEFSDEETKKTKKQDDVVSPRKRIIQNRKPKKECYVCLTEIKDSNFMISGNFKFHNDCFVCCKCKEFITGKYANKKGVLTCESCLYKKDSKKTKKTCASCKEPIIKGKLNALGKYYHKKCFNCQKCGTEFIKNKFYDLNGEPVCKPCKKKFKKK